MRYYIIVARPQDSGIALIRSGQRWTLPNFTPQVTDARQVDHINAEMRRMLGLDTVTLRCAQSRIGGAERDNWRVFVALARNSNAQLLPGARWATQSDLRSTEFAPPALTDAVNAWFAEKDNPSPRRAPWHSAVWFDSAFEWIHARLDALGMPAIAPVRQLRAWGLSCAMRIATDGGDVYFKATPPFMAHEGRVMQAVAERYPALLPPPLAVDNRRGWLLMPDYGSAMLHESPDVARWETALRLFARMQVEQAAHTRDWLAIGCPDRGLGRMVDLIDPLIMSSSRLLDGKPYGLAADEIDRLRALSIRLKLMCARLAQYALPHTLVHGDLGGNILINNGGYVFFDWTDACISHPFFDMATISGAYFDRSALQSDPSVDDRLRDAYLEAWAAHEPAERLIEAYEAAKRLGALHQAMTYMWILANIAEDERAELEGGLAHWLRSLLRLCG